MTAAPDTSPAIERLHKDHINILRLLKVLTHQVSLVNEGEPVNLDIFRGMITFYREYVEKFHHPLEDLIYEILEKSFPTAALGAYGIYEDHRDCADSLNPLERAINTVESALKGMMTRPMVIESR